MAAVLKYENGVLSLKSDSHHYFDIDLDGRVRVYREWYTVDVRMGKVAGLKFLLDFLKRRKLKRVEYDRKVEYGDFRPYVSYDVVLVYEDCKVCIDFEGARYMEVLLLCSDFVMTFSWRRFMVRLFNFSQKCEVVDRAGVMWDYLEMMISGFSNEKIDTSAKCKFKSFDKGFSIYVNGAVLFSVGFDKVRCSDYEFIYYKANVVEEADVLYEFMWNLYEESVDRFEYVRKGDIHILKAGNLEVRYSEWFDDLAFVYEYSGSGFSFRIRLDCSLGQTYIWAMLENGAKFECMFKSVAKLFRRLVKTDGRIERYIKGINF